MFRFQPVKSLVDLSLVQEVTCNLPKSQFLNVGHDRGSDATPITMKLVVVEVMLQPRLMGKGEC